MYEFSEVYYNAYCCVAPPPKQAPGNDCPVYEKAEQGEIISWLSAGEHVEVLTLGGPTGQFWQIKEGWVMRGHLKFWDEDIKEAFVSIWGEKNLRRRK